MNAPAWSDGGLAEETILVDVRWGAFGSTVIVPIVRCKHCRSNCEECGLSARRDAPHRTIGGRGAVGRLRGTK